MIEREIVTRTMTYKEGRFMIAVFRGLDRTSGSDIRRDIWLTAFLPTGTMGGRD